MSPRALALGVLFALQLGVPLSLVAQHELTRAQGSLWRFQTAPVDPADPFRGRYVQLSFAVERDPVPLSGVTPDQVLGSPKRLYAHLVRDAQGYARLESLHLHPPAGEYLEVQMTGVAEGPVPAALYVRLPFDRYYLNEDLAPAVEQAYAQAGREARERSYAEVRLRGGHAALTALVLDGQPVD